MKVHRMLLPLLLAAGVSAQGDETTPMSDALDSAGFDAVADDQGVMVYVDPNSEIVRVAAEGQIDASPEKVREALLDYEHQVGVMKRLTESRVLERGSDSLLVYQRLTLPIVDDRDYTLRVKWGADGRTLWVKYTAVADQGPAARDGIVRVSNHSGSWQLSPIRSGEATWARFQMHMDLAGWIPHSLARSGAGDEVPALFASVRQLATTERGEVTP